MLNLLSRFGAQQSGIAALGVDGKTFVIQLITFIIVILVLKKYAVKPILQILADRRETIEKGVSLGEKMLKDEAEMERKVGAALQKARVQADEIINDASERGRQSISNAEAKAKQKAESIIASAEERTRQDITRARHELESEFAELIADATEVIIEEKVDLKKDSALIDRALKGAAK